MNSTETHWAWLTGCINFTIWQLNFPKLFASLVYKRNNDYKRRVLSCLNNGRKTNVECSEHSEWKIIQNYRTCLLHGLRTHLTQASVPRCPIFYAWGQMRCLGNAAWLRVLSQHAHSPKSQADHTKYFFFGSVILKVSISIQSTPNEKK